MVCCSEQHLHFTECVLTSKQQPLTLGKACNCPAVCSSIVLVERCLCLLPSCSPHLLIDDCWVTCNTLPIKGQPRTSLNMWGETSFTKAKLLFQDKPGKKDKNKTFPSRLSRIFCCVLIFFFNWDMVIHHFKVYNLVVYSISYIAVQSSPLSNFGAFSSFQKETPYPLAITPPPHPPHQFSLRWLLTYFLTLWFTYFGCFI